MGRYFAETTLGMAIISWSHCEEAVEHLLRDILQFHGLERDTADLIAATLDLKSRCALGIALTYKLDIPLDLMERLSAAVNSVQNDLRNRRNRLFHDSWMFKEGAIHKRVSTGPKLKRPQARQLGLDVPDYAPADLGEVIEFSKRSVETSQEIHDLLGLISQRYFSVRVAELEAQQEALGARCRRPRTGLSRLLRRIFGKREPAPPPPPD